MSYKLPLAAGLMSIVAGVVYGIQDKPVSAVLGGVAGALWFLVADIKRRDQGGAR